MTPLPDAEWWNILLACGGGLGLAALKRSLSPYTGLWAYAPHWTKDLAASPLALQLRPLVAQLDEIRPEHTLGYTGERREMQSLIQARLAEQAGFGKPPEVFERIIYEPKPKKLEYLVCFSNVESSRRSAQTARQLAAAVVAELQWAKKPVQAYALGADLVSCGGAASVLRATPQPGFNLFHCLETLHRRPFEHPTYVLSFTDSLAAVTDQAAEAAALRRMLQHDKLIYAFLECGPPAAPYSIRNLATFLNAPYLSLSGPMQGLATLLQPVFEEASQRMRKAVGI